MNGLSGNLVVVHPDLTTDPASMQGKIGVIATADLKNDTITVGFGEGGLGRYSSDALLVLKDKNELYEDIMTSMKELGEENFRILFGINLKQDRGDFANISQALNQAVANPEVMKRSMISLEDYISKNMSIDVSEAVSR